jgi:hypothetical protein
MELGLEGHYRQRLAGISANWMLLGRYFICIGL